MSMVTLNEFILEKTFSGKIDLETGTELLQLAKRESNAKPALEIAIIGIGLKMPGADNVRQFWANLKNGVDCITELADSRRRDSERLLAYLDWNPGTIEYAPGGYLQAIDQFDYAFFRMAPNEANVMDPSQRLFLETAWQTIEDSGYGGHRLSGSRTGVYVGFNGWPVYGEAALHSNPEAAALSMLGNLASVIPSRIAYLLDLHGPAVTIDTACSSSLTAVHLACQGIRNGDCELAIAGGVNLRLIPLKNIGSLGIESSTNRTRTFDQLSDGTVWGEGVAAILLKPLAKALADGDHIEAVIKISSLNQDGSSIGMTAPNVLAQEEMIVKAWQDSGINPETITYIEAHGTGTPLGDPIEIDALTRGFRRFTPKKQFCAIGSVKSNFGHLDGASGVTGLIKAVLALKNQEIPPSLHFCQPNRKIDFTESPVYVNDRLSDWPAEDYPRRAGVNSFGLSGTNCHVILEEAPESKITSLPGRVWHLLAVSAKSVSALANIMAQYQTMLAEDPTIDLNALCFTANTGRGHYDHRLALVIRDAKDFCAKLNNLNLSKLEASKIPGVFYGKHKISPETKRTSTIGELTAGEWRTINAAVQNKLEQDLNLQDLNPDLLAEIAQFYIQGANIDWSRLYPSGNRVNLPVYPFEKSRCWLELPVKSAVQSASIDKSAWYYHPVWRLENQIPNNTTQIGKNVILLNTASGNEGQLFEKLGHHFEVLGSTVMRVKRGVQFQALGANDYEVSGTIQDYQLLFEPLLTALPTQIILLAATGEQPKINDLAALVESQEHGVVYLSNLSQALVNLKVKHDLDLVLVGANVHQVTGHEESLQPEQATLFGLGKVLRMEHLNLHCRCIDIDQHLEVAQLLAELQNPAQNYLVAFRNGDRYIEELAKLDLAAMPEQEVRFHDTGVYVITGGSGGIGLEVSKYLARQGKVNLALLQRSQLPERSNWEAILAQAAEPRLSRTLRTILEIEQTGAKLTTYSIDIVDEFKMKELLSELRRQYGRINGIVHSAGLPGDGLSLVETLKPKVQGTWLLHQLTLEDDLDFFLMFSSGMTLTGGIGVGAYTAANSYLDSFAAYRHQTKSHEITTTINWPTWRDSVMKGANERLAEERQLFKFIANQEATALLDQILHHNMLRVIIGQLNFQSSILHFQEYLPFKLAPELKNTYLDQQAGSQSVQTKNALEPQPKKAVKLNGRATGIYTETERYLARIWGEVLGFQEINIEESFYDLGGDSIKAVQVIAKLPEFKLEIVDTLRYPTIAGLSEFLETVRSSGAPGFKPTAAIEVLFTQGDFEYLPEYPSAKILEPIGPFNEVLYKDCFYNAFFPVIKHFQREIYSFLADDLVVYEYHPLNEEVRLDINYRSRQGIEQLLDKLGISHTKKSASPHLIRDLIRALAENHPVIIRVDCFYEPNRYDTFHEDHWEHCLLIYGYDQTSQVFYCLEHDNLNSLLYKPLMMGYYHLLQAYRGYLDHFHQDTTLPSFYEFGLETADSLPEPDWNADLRQHVLAQKTGLLNQFALLEMFQNDWQLWISNQDKLTREIDQLVYLINKILKAKYTEQYQIRNLFSDQAAALLDLLAAIIAGWDYLKMTVEKYKYSHRFREHEFKTATEKLTEISQLERNFYQLLFTILGI